MLHCQMIQAGELQAVVGDASRNGVGGTQYTGLWSLASSHYVFNAFGNSYAGLLPSEIRGAEPTLETVDDTTVALTRKANAKHASNCRATYRVRAPYYIDHTLTIRDEADLRIKVPGAPGYREVAWCCYMNSPEDSRLNFLSRGEWFRYISPKHGVGSNIAPSYVPENELEIFPPRNTQGEPFHIDRIERRFDQPFYYGRVGPMAMILIFDTPRWLRFYCSPSGGGPSILPGKNCPAWDFEWLIPAADYHVGKEYAFRVRLVYKRFISDDDVLAEVQKGQRELGFERVG